MASYHKSNLGAFGRDLICDIDGYTHTTADEWKSAPVDGDFCDPVTGEYDEDYHDEWAQEQADASIKALAEAEEALAQWREQNA